MLFTTSHRYLLLRDIREIAVDNIVGVIALEYLSQRIQDDPHGVIPELCSTDVDPLTVDVPFVVIRAVWTDSLLAVVFARERLFHASVAFAILQTEAGFETFADLLPRGIGEIVIGEACHGVVMSVTCVPEPTLSLFQRSEGVRATIVHERGEAKKTSVVVVVGVEEHEIRTKAA